MLDLKTGIGKTGVAIAILVAVAMSLLNLLFHPVDIEPIRYGLCLPSPDAWDLAKVLSWGINLGIIGLITVLIYFINKTYNFIRTTEPVAVALFLVMATSSAWFTQSLNSSVILCLANVVCMGIIFTTYDVRNATQQMFVMGFVVGIGSLFQYAFLPMALAYFLWALFMKVLRVKETLAFMVGILCPYWITLGSGLLKFSDLHFPSLNPLLGVGRDHSDFIVLLAGIALAAGGGFAVTLLNSMKLYAGNSKVNAMNLCVSALGAVSVICILIDFDNMPAYVITLYMAAAVQIANICALWNPKMPWLVTCLPAACYLALFVCGLIL